MRQTKHSLDALLPRTRQAVLSAFLMNPDRWWYRSDLAKHLGVAPSSLQRELTNLVAAEILLLRREGKLVYYRANSENPFFPDLAGVLAKTVGLANVLRDALHPIRRRILSALIYGSVARSAERAGSDIDLMIIGDATLAELSPLLRKAEHRLGRPVNATIYSRTEFKKRLAGKHHFLQAVLEKEKIFIIGTEHELEGARSSGPPRSA